MIELFNIAAAYFFRRDVKLLNLLLKKFLADLLGTEVATIGMPDVSALGAALLAGLQRGTFEDTHQLEQLDMARHAYGPGPGAEMARASYEGWKNTVARLVALQSQ